MSTLDQNYLLVFIMVLKNCGINKQIFFIAFPLISNYITNYHDNSQLCC